MSCVSEHEQTGISLRTAEERDLSAINNIYNHYVSHSTATFETAEKTLEERKAWWDEHLRLELPVYVAEQSGRVLGWASLNLYHGRCAYRQTLEPSLYIDHEHQRLGLGRRLMERLLTGAREWGCHCVVLLICSENAGSLELARQFGFEEVGTLKEVGRKFDRWLDVTIAQRIL